MTVSTSKFIVTSTTTAAAVKEKNKVVKSEKLVLRLWQLASVNTANKIRTKLH